MCHYCSRENVDYISHTVEYGKAISICDDCVTKSKNIKDCSICLAPKYLEDYSTMSEKHLERIHHIYSKFSKIISNFIICNHCISHFYRSCASCEDTNYIPILYVFKKTDFDSEGDYHIRINRSIYNNMTYRDSAIYRNRRRENNIPLKILHRESKDLSKHFIEMNSELYCLDCHNRHASRLMRRPPRRLNDSAFVSATNKYFDMKRFIGIESEMLNDDLPTEYDEEYDFHDYIDSPRGWELVHDGSLSAGGVELRTNKPVQSDMIKVLLNSLDRHILNHDTSVDDSCGVHIHFNALDLGLEYIKNLLHIMKHIEPIIFDTLPSHREDNRYCKPIYKKIDSFKINKIQNISDLCRFWYNQIGETDFDMNHYNDSRYFGLNLHSRFYMGTIEFRYHEGTVDTSDIYGWIKFLRSIVNKSIEITENSSETRDILRGKDTLQMSPIEQVEMIGGRESAHYIEGRLSKKLK